jgi:hypothetical protein
MTPFEWLLIAAAYMTITSFMFGFLISRDQKNQSKLSSGDILFFGLFWPITLLTYFPYCIGEFTASLISINKAK